MMVVFRGIKENHCSVVEMFGGSRTFSFKLEAMAVNEPSPIPLDIFPYLTVNVVKNHLRNQHYGICTLIPHSLNQPHLDPLNLAL